MEVDISKLPYNKKSSVTKSRKKSTFFTFNKKISDKNKLKFYRELSLLIKSGIDIKNSLNIIANQSKGKNRDLILKIKSDIESGKSLKNAMMTTGEFSPYEYYSVQIGEETKRLDKILKELQVFFDKKVQIRRQIISVITYPIFVIVITVSVLIFMLNSVVPMFADVFKQFGNELPKLTQKIIYLSNNLSKIILLTILPVFLFALFHYKYKNHPSYRDITSKVLLKVPFFGKFIKTIFLARFSQSMNLLLTTKTPLLDSLTLVKKMINYYPIEISIDYIKKDIIGGSTLSNSLEKHSIFDVNLVSMIKVAEEVNELDVMFGELSSQYNKELEHKSKILGVVIEPLIITIIGVIVGVVLVSMYIPMFDLSKILNN